MDRNRRTVSDYVDLACGIVFWAAVVAFWLVLLTLPMLLGRSYGAGAGLITSLAAIPAWKHLGPAPCPGFLSGIICVNGYIFLVGTAILMLTRLKVG
jgi:hypothetical protein